MPAPPPTDDITRRDLLKGVGALGAGWVVAGCADRTPGPTAPPEASRTVRHLFGALSLTGMPERIVTVNDRCEFESLLSLGVRPYATGVMDGEAPWQAGLDLEGIVTFPGLQSLAVETDVEQLLTLEPDIVIGPAGPAEPGDVQVLAEAVSLFVTGASLPGSFGW